MLGAVLFSAKAIVVKFTYRYGIDAVTPDCLSHAVCDALRGGGLASVTPAARGDRDDDKQRAHPRALSSYNNCPA